MADASSILLFPILYSFRRCPYAMRSRWALAQAGLRVEIREILLRDKPAALREASPKATVPVLVLPDRTVLEQSLDIMLWALRQQDPAGWLAAADWAQQQALIDVNDGEFKALLDRYKYPQRHPGQDAAASRDAAVALLLAPLDARLARGPFLFGAHCSVADVALLPFVRQFAAVDPAWFDAAPLPHLRGWLARELASPLFDAVMTKRPPWQPGDEPVYC